MRAAAAAVLSRHGALDLSLRLDETRRELARVKRELAVASGQVPWWERTSGTTADPTRVEGLQARVSALEEVERERCDVLDRALDAAQAEMPPIEVARRVTRCLLGARSAALGVTTYDEALVRELEELSDRTLAIWAPGLVADAANDELMDPARASLAATSEHGPVREDAVLGWVPASPDEIVGRAARALHRPEVDAARARLVRERAEYESFAARLREMRKGASTWRRMTGNDAEEARAIAWMAQRTQIEEHELTAAWESLHHEVGEALAATPPLHVARTAVAAAGILRARLTTWEAVIALSGQTPGAMMFMRSASRRGRAVMFAALRELKVATEAAFPGVLELLTPRGAEAAVRDEASRGPYRQRPEAEPPQEGPRGADLVTTVIARATAAGLDARVGAIVAHGAALGAMSRQSRRVARERGFFGRIGAWVSSEDDPVAARERWHRALAFSMLDQAEATVANARRGLFILDFRAALAAAATEYFAITLHSDRTLFDLTCTLRRHHETMMALAEARRVLVAAWGDPGDRMALIEDLLAYLRSGVRGPHPFPPGTPPRALHRHELVVALGESLRGTAFLATADRVIDANRRCLEAGRQVAHAAARITFWDRLNFFTDSEAEATKAAQTAVGEATLQEGRSAFQAVHALLEQAFVQYPPAAVLYRLEEATYAVNEVRAVKVLVRAGKNSYYECQLWGGPYATAALSRLATATFQAFGPMLSDTEILAAHWERALDQPLEAAR